MDLTNLPNNIHQILVLSYQINIIWIWIYNLQTFEKVDIIMSDQLLLSLMMIRHYEEFKGLLLTKYSCQIFNIIYYNYIIEYFNLIV